MNVPVPFARADVLLLAVLPCVWLLARTLVHSITLDRTQRLLLSVGLTLALWLSGVHVASLLAGSLAVGLPLATIALGVAGVFAESVRRRRTDAPQGENPPTLMWISMAVTAALLAPATFRFWFHDELSFTGHMSIAAALQNPIYPPRHLAFPDALLRHHYGFDLVTACLTALLRLPVDRAIDVASVALWCTTWCLFWGVGDRLTSQHTAGLTPLLALFAGGIPLACDHPGPSVWDSLLVSCGVGNDSVNAPVISFFFQHPWALGLPLMATAALLLTERSPRNEWARYFALGVTLSLLALAEIAVFAGVVPAIVVAEAAFDGKVNVRRGARMAAVAAMAVGVAGIEGGFFAHVPAGRPLELVLHAGYMDDWRETVVWNLKSFGVLLPLGIWGLVCSRCTRLFWSLLAIGGFVVLNAARFVGTGDIVKFGTLAAIALAVLGSGAIARFLESRSAWRVAVAAAVTLSATAASFGFLLGFALDRPSIPAALRRHPESMTADEVDAMTFVRRHARAGETVYSDKHEVAWAQWGGVPGAFRSWTDGVFGLPTPPVHARSALLKERPAEAARYRAEGFAWFALDGDAGPMAPVCDAWVRDGSARESGRFGDWRVIEIAAEPTKGP